MLYAPYYLSTKPYLVKCFYTGQRANQRGRSGRGSGKEGANDEKVGKKIIFKKWFLDVPDIPECTDFIDNFFNLYKIDNLYIITKIIKKKEQFFK